MRTNSGANGKVKREGERNLGGVPVLSKARSATGLSVVAVPVENMSSANNKQTTRMMQKVNEERKGSHTFIGDDHLGCAEVGIPGKNISTKINTNETGGE